MVSMRASILGRGWVAVLYGAYTHLITINGEGRITVCGIPVTADSKTGVEESFDCPACRDRLAT